MSFVTTEDPRRIRTSRFLGEVYMSAVDLAIFFRAQLDESRRKGASADVLQAISFMANLCEQSADNRTDVHTFVAKDVVPDLLALAEELRQP